jgi:hypothetical protein
MLEGFVTLEAVALSFAALDDITTDWSTDYSFEYMWLTACAVWCGILAVTLVRRGHRALGAASMLLLAAGVWGQNGVGPGTQPDWHPEFVATAAALVWFAALSVALFAIGLIDYRRRRPVRMY